MDAHRWTDGYVTLMAFCFPLFTGLHGYQHVAEAKYGLTLSLTAVWLLGMCFFRIKAAKRSGQTPETPKRSFSRENIRGVTAVGACLLVFLLWAGLAAVLSPYPASVLDGDGRHDGTVSLLCYVLIAHFAAKYGTLRRRHLYALAASVTLCCLVALAQSFDLDPLWLFPHGWRFSDAGTLYSGLYLGTVGNTLILASVLSLSIPLFIGYALLWRQWFLLVPAALALYILFVSDASSAFVALAGSLMLAPLCAKKKLRLRLFIAECAAVLTVVTLLFLFPPEGGTLRELALLLRGQAEDSFGSSRIRIWRAVWAAFRERPWLGTGAGTLSHRIDITFSRFVPETGETLRTFVANAHNEYLGYLASLGIPGAAVYLGAIGCTLFSPLREGKRRLPVLWALTAYWIQAFFALGSCCSAPLLWLAWGLFFSDKKAQTEPRRTPVAR